MLKGWGSIDYNYYFTRYTELESLWNISYLYKKRKCSHMI